MYPSNAIWQRFKKNRPALGAAAFLLLIIIFAIAAPWISSHTYYDINLLEANQPPNAAYWFGTDDLGRDLFTRIAFGARISLCVGVTAALLDLLIGTFWGGVAGMMGGWVDEIMMRIADILYALPYLLIVTLFILILGTSLFTIIAAMAIIGWITMARVVRSQLLLLKTQEYIIAAEGWGASRGRILCLHMLPNAIGPLVVTLTMTVPSAIFTEAFLSFIGLGIQAPLASWGTLVSEGLPAVEYYPWRFFIPAIFVSAAILAFNVIGEGLREASDLTQHHRIGEYQKKL